MLGGVGHPDRGSDVAQTAPAHLDVGEFDELPHRVEHGHVRQVLAGLLELVAQHTDVELGVVRDEHDHLVVVWRNSPSSSPAMVGKSGSPSRCSSVMWWTRRENASMGTPGSTSRCQRLRTVAARQVTAATDTQRRGLPSGVSVVSVSMTTSRSPSHSAEALTAAPDVVRDR